MPFEIKSIIGRLKQLQATEKEIKKCKDTVKSFMVATNTSIAKSDTVTVSLKENSGDNYSVDVNKLRVEQPDIYARYRVPAKKYSYVQII